MKKRKNDLILLGVLLGLSLTLFLFLTLTRRAGTQVVVYREGVRVAAYPLDESRRVTIDSAKGTNTLVIEGGEAFLSDADCPDRLCVHMGRIRYDGQTIVCLPHKVIVAVEGGGKEPGVEAGKDVDVVAK